MAIQILHALVVGSVPKARKGKAGFRKSIVWEKLGFFSRQVELAQMGVGRRQVFMRRYSPGQTAQTAFSSSIARHTRGHCRK